MDTAGIVRAARSSARAPIHSTATPSRPSASCLFGDAADIDSFSLSAHKLADQKASAFSICARGWIAGTGGGRKAASVPAPKTSGARRCWRICWKPALNHHGWKPSGGKRKIGFAADRLHQNTKRCSTVPSDRAEADPAFLRISPNDVRDLPGETLVRMLDDAGIAISTGSACSQPPDRPSFRRWE